MIKSLSVRELKTKLKKKTFESGYSKRQINMILEMCNLCHMYPLSKVL